MELVESSKHGMSILFSHYYSSLMHSGNDFLMKPVFQLGVSGSLHLLLLFMLFISWVCNTFKVAHCEGPNGRFKNIRCLFYKQAQICCLGVSLFSLVLCLLSYFYWYRNGWSDEGLVTLFDLALSLGFTLCLLAYSIVQFSLIKEPFFIESLVGFLSLHFLLLPFLWCSPL